VTRSLTPLLQSSSTQGDEMHSSLVNSTLQAAVLAALSNFLAQGLKAYKSGV
jgi:hypothetical protein